MINIEIVTSICQKIFTVVLLNFEVNFVTVQVCTGIGEDPTSGCKKELRCQVLSLITTSGFICQWNPVLTLDIITTRLFRSAYNPLEVVV